MRCVALDVGEVRVGVAGCDSLEISCAPITTYVRKGGLKRDIAGVVSLIAPLGAECIVIGLPLSLDGNVGSQAERILGFAKALRLKLDIPVVMWDESLTSVEAHERMEQLGYSRERRRSNVDQVAASLILESYLRHRRPFEPRTN